MSNIPTVKNPPREEAAPHPKNDRKQKNEGDNPNKSNAKPRSTSASKVSSLTTKLIAESIDPIVPQTNTLTIHDITDMRAPGSQIIGKIYPRVEFLTEFADLMQQMIQSSRALVTYRVNMPRLDHVAMFISYYVMAFQYFQTLDVDMTQGHLRSFRALSMIQLRVPDFVPPLVHNFGNYKTSEGTVKVAAIELLIPHLVEKALSEYVLIDNVRPLPGYHHIEDFVIYETSDLRTDLTDLVKMVHPVLFLPFDLIVAPGITLEVDLRLDTADVVAVNALLNAGSIQAPPGVLNLIRAYVFVRDLTYLQLGAPNAILQLNVLGFAHGSIRPLSMYRDWLNIAIPSYTVVCSFVIETLFHSSVFVPSTSGTSAQFVVQANANIDSTEATHEFAIAPNSQIAGFLLMPSIKVEFAPEYVVMSPLSRFGHFMQMTEKFIRRSHQ